MYFIFAVIIVSSMTYYTFKAKTALVKKIVYGVIFLGIFGTAFFPFNTFSKSPTAFTINIHNDFGIVLMLATTVSFILSIILSKSKAHKLTAGLSLIYAGVFIFLYFTGIPLMFSTFFIWENLFIGLLFLEMYMERYE